MISQENMERLNRLFSHDPAVVDKAIGILLDQLQSQHDEAEGGKTA